MSKLQQWKTNEPKKKVQRLHTNGSLVAEARKSATSHQVQPVHGGIVFLGYLFLHLDLGRIVVGRPGGGSGSSIVFGMIKWAC